MKNFQLTHSGENNTKYQKIKFSNFCPRLQINWRKSIICPWQEISHIKMSENFVLKLGGMRDVLKIRDL